MCKPARSSLTVPELIDHRTSQAKDHFAVIVVCCIGEYFVVTHLNVRRNRWAISAMRNFIDVSIDAHLDQPIKIFWHLLCPCASFSILKCPIRKRDMITLLVTDGVPCLGTRPRCSCLAWSSVTECSAVARGVHLLIGEETNLPCLFEFPIPCPMLFV